MSEITELIRAHSQHGDTVALQTAFDRLYPELKRLAGARLAVMGGGRTLTPTSLVHEAYDRLIQSENLDVRGRRHFFSLAGKAMRYIIVDYLRAGRALKRGGDQVMVTLTENVAADSDIPQLLDLDRALDELNRFHPLRRELVELRFFAGRSMAEIAELLELSERTAWREWSKARAFLHARIEGEGTSGQT